jgi:hypothetical protein
VPGALVDGTPTARSPSFWSMLIIFLVFTGAALLFGSWFRFEKRRHRDRAEPRDRASTDA